MIPTSSRLAMDDVRSISPGCAAVNGTAKTGRRPRRPPPGRLRLIRSHTNAVPGERQMPLLEVIALTADDARAAEDGGADRLEVVADMAADGLTPDPDVVEAVRKATTLPLRVMLRARAGFRTTAFELDRLRRAAAGLADAGADGFVFGFLDSSGHIDTAATGKLAADTAPLPWTFHRAVDHAA